MSFNLNIAKYNLDELKSIFELPNIYDLNMLNNKETMLKQNISNNKTLSVELKTNTIDFIINATNILKNEYYTNTNLPNTNIEQSSSHIIQQKPSTPYINTYPTEHFPGVINPIKKRTVQKNLNINTKFRENYYNSISTNFNTVLPITINDVINIKLSTIEFPTTFYNISNTYDNNYFKIIVTGITSGSEECIVELPSGNYSINYLINKINSLLLFKGGLFQNVFFLADAVGTDGTGRMSVNTIATPTEEITNIFLDFNSIINNGQQTTTPLQLKLGWMMGFRNCEYTDGIGYLSEGIIDLQNIKYAYLVIDDFNNNFNNSFFAAFNDSILNKSILARVSICQNAFSTTAIYNNSYFVDFIREYYGPVNIGKLNIQLLDDYGRIIDLNNMDFSFCLTMETIYDL
mgnify:CR=1 FL=1